MRNHAGTDSPTGGQEGAQQVPGASGKEQFLVDIELYTLRGEEEAQKAGEEAWGAGYISSLCSSISCSPLVLHRKG